MQLDAALLPESLHDLVDAIGLQATLRLVEAFGGCRIWVPAEIEEDHAIAKAVGFLAARKLAAHCGLSQLTIPRAVEAVRAARNVEIRTRRADGASTAELARDYALTERAIWRILAADDGPDPRQTTLF